MHVYHQYTIRVADDRDGFAAELSRRGVGTGVYYPTPIHRLPSFDETLGPARDRRVRPTSASRCPVHPSLDDADLDQIVEAVNAVARAGA